MAIPKTLLLAIVGCICLCSSVVLSARELGDAAMVERHEQWMAKFNRVYKDGTEKAQRFEVFKANVAFIESFNAGNHKFWLGVNQFTDLTNDEFKATKTNKGLKRSGSQAPTGFKYNNVSTDALPAAVDWRTKGAVTPIKDQGQCGKQIFV
uniref:Cathepsin propeptide inhibitor domain-containing protein n=1 Tax=Aegilops tauschii subsp. strangulata TaxID=200361 RepID=A0A453H5P0_AEGTS